MRRRVPIAPIFVLIAGLMAAVVFAQVRPNPNAIQREERLQANGVEPGDPQFRPRQQNPRRIPQGPGGQAGRLPNNPLQARRQEIRRRVMQAIGLTPDQRFRMQEIRRTHDDEVISAGRRLRQARAALDRAIMNETYSEAAVQRATEELAGAQADKIRLDSRIRAQVRGVLTPEQVVRFHVVEREIRQQMRQELRDQQQQGMELSPDGRPPLPPIEEFDIVGLLLWDN